MVPINNALVVSYEIPFSCDDSYTVIFNWILKVTRYFNLLVECDLWCLEFKYFFHSTNFLRNILFLTLFFKYRYRRLMQQRHSWYFFNEAIRCRKTMVVPIFILLKWMKMAYMVKISKLTKLVFETIVNILIMFSWSLPTLFHAAFHVVYFNRILAV